MSTLYLWLQREGERQAQRPDLMSALVSGRGGAYARTRLLPVILRLLLRTALHGVELHLLSRALPIELLAPLLAYRGLVALIGTAHWGALEGLRQRVRACLRVRETAAARGIVERWLAWSGLLTAAPVVGFALVIVASARGVGPGISLSDCYGLACFLRLALDVYARTHHAGVFAVRRVYRPAASWVIADVLELAVLVLCFDRLGPWCLPIGIALAGALDALVSIAYARRAYLVQGLLVPRLWRRPQLRVKLTWRSLREVLLHSLANASMQLDGLLLLMLLAVDPPRSGTLSLALVYYMLRPLLGFAAHWVRSFYFDLSRMEAGALVAWRPRLSRYLLRISLTCASILSVLSLGCAAGLWPEQIDRSLLWLVPFLFARSLFAQLQLEAFVRGQYRVLLQVTSGLVLGLGAYTLAAPSGTALLNATSLMLALGYVLMRNSSERRVSSATTLGLAEWLHVLRGSEAVRVGVLSVARSSVRPGRVVALLESKVAGIRIARYARSHLLLFVPAASAPSLASWVALAGGTLRDAWLSQPCHGSNGMALARAQHALPSELQVALTPALIAPSAAVLTADFRRDFAGGTVLDLVTGNGTLASERLPRAVLGELIQQVGLASRQRDGAPRSALPVELAVYAPTGQATLIFVVARGTAGFATFRARVRAASMHASYYGPMQHKQDASGAAIPTY